MVAHVVDLGQDVTPVLPNAPTIRRTCDLFSLLAKHHHPEPNHRGLGNDLREGVETSGRGEVVCRECLAVSWSPIIALPESGWPTRPARGWGRCILKSLPRTSRGRHIAHKTRHLRELPFGRQFGSYGV